MKRMPTTGLSGNSAKTSGGHLWSAALEQKQWTRSKKIDSGPTPSGRDHRNVAFQEQKEPRETAEQQERCE